MGELTAINSGLCALSCCIALHGTACNGVLSRIGREVTYTPGRPCSARNEVPKSASFMFCEPTEIKKRSTMPGKRPKSVRPFGMQFEEIKGYARLE